MTPVTLAAFQSADQISDRISVTQSKNDPLMDVIKTFGTRVDRFCEDLSLTVTEFVDDTLYDAMELREDARELETIISIISKRRTGLLEKAQQIIDECQAAGHTEEDNLKIVSHLSQGRRTVDRDLLLKERKDVYDLLLNMKVESVKIDYTPTIADLKTVLKKRHEAYLKPGEISTTYDLEVILPEKAAEVEL
jgi:hypothetical protein